MTNDIQYLCVKLLFFYLSINILLKDNIVKHNAMDTWSDSHIGFYRAKLSTAYDIADATNFITSNLDNNNFTMSIFLDLRKTFVTVDHKITNLLNGP